MKGFCFKVDAPVSRDQRRWAEHVASDPSRVQRWTAEGAHTTAQIRLRPELSQSSICAWTRHLQNQIMIVQKTKWWYGPLILWTRRDLWIVLNYTEFKPVSLLAYLLTRTIKNVWLCSLVFIFINTYCINKKPKCWVGLLWFHLDEQLIYKQIKAFTIT